MEEIGEDGFHVIVTSLPDLSMPNALPRARDETTSYAEYPAQESMSIIRLEGLLDVFGILLLLLPLLLPLLFLLSLPLFLLLLQRDRN